MPCFFIKMTGTEMTLIIRVALNVFFFHDNDNFVIKLISLSFPDSDREN